jgi:hypothetical protein
MWQVCPACGAVVADTALHNDHHAELGHEPPFPPIDTEAQSHGD